ncbi:MAG: hypothetical protein VX066_11120 [Pseudomonadota bacterium]|jgi:hypothetical protein|uniref:Uncharacterized protein n=1 Tax=Marisediminitalea aggregata TaxID=634436 RepID=A0A1M5PPY1_9ALTE|nr:hypothetical protein [Marisediminitalea aggregata]MAH55314.1 hypothetical protein [Aestuariibacter sp.]MAP19404.1 hypothetical protein [Alteromonadaceae bacterium]MCP4864884.1 hypothetical protein [Alteromonas sp.]MEC7469352.1 hypothetical protein [Pseudomonadota bacterium]BBO27771.1 hypothetical protein AltI4_21590 [Alteromonas sp. I4]|tara:strand:- start:1366 stop:1650 length:285 start_codon:yes stop_codon:yes gene_type:complete
MKHLIDIQVVLATWQDMEDVFEEPDEAAERLNTILHMVYDRAEEDISVERLEGLLSHTWSIWHQDENLLYVNDDDLLDWVDHLLATWDDADNLD